MENQKINGILGERLMKKILIVIFLLCLNFANAAEVTILHTSDTHGRISPIEYKGVKDVGGFSRRVYFFSKTKYENRNVLLLDSGDVFQGSVYYRLDKGLLNAKLLSYIKYDAITLGNHEFDNGLKTLKRNIKKSKTTFLSANVHFKDAYLKKYIKPYIIKEIDGEKFLIIGVTTKHLGNLTTTANIKITNPSEEIFKIIQSVKYDKLIILSHCGLDEDKEIAKKFPQIDLILGGHNHFFFEYPVYVNSVPIIQDGEFGIRVGKIKFDENVKSYTYENITSSIPKSDKAEMLISKTDKKLLKYNTKVIANTLVTLVGDQKTLEHSQTNLGKLVLKSMVRPFKDYDVVLTNSGSIRINRNLNNVVTYADLLEILPFENKIVMLQMKGKNLKSALKQGKDQTNRRYLQVYSKLKEIDDEKMYNVVTNDYIARGKDGYKEFKNCKIIKISREKPSVLLYKTLTEIKTITNESIKF